MSLACPTSSDVLTCAQRSEELLIVLRDVKLTKLANDCCEIYIGSLAENKGFFLKKQASVAPIIKKELLCQIYENLPRC